MIDIDNQRRQQVARRTPAGAEPYVGAIVGPWDRRNGGAVSQVTWYCVRHRGEGLQTSGEPCCTLIPVSIDGKATPLRATPLPSSHELTPCGR